MEFSLNGHVHLSGWMGILFGAERDVALSDHGMLQLRRKAEQSWAVVGGFVYYFVLLRWTKRRHLPFSLCFVSPF